MRRADAVVELVRWWADHGDRAPPIEIANDFLYDSPLQCFESREEFVTGVAVRGRCLRVRLLGCVEGDSGVAVLFDGVEEVTLLEHRWAWLVQFGSADEITRIVCVYSQGIPPREGTG